MTSQTLSQIEECLWAEGSRRGVWMIVDSARDRRIYGLLLEYFYSDHFCLFSGAMTPELRVTAPYLIQLEYDDSKTRSFMAKAWGNNWGVFVRCDTRMESLRRHLRGILMVREPKGGRVLFRYYDPRVLRLYLPSCNSEELQRFFGPMDCFWSEGETPDTLMEFGMDGTRLDSRELLLDGRAIPPAAFQRKMGGSFDPARARSGMLAIRKAQWAMFSRSEVLKFEDWMVNHLMKFFPVQCARLGQGKLRETIQYGIERAASYDLTVKRDVCKYIDVMISLGRDFDRDTRFLWAPRVLQQGNPRTKAQTLLDAGVDHLKSRASSRA